jgi:hypothetical protein
MNLLLHDKGAVGRGLRRSCGRNHLEVRHRSNGMHAQYGRRWNNDSLVNLFHDSPNGHVFQDYKLAIARRPRLPAQADI